MAALRLPLPSGRVVDLFLRRGRTLLERAEQALCQGLGDVPITRDDRLRDHVTGER